MNSPRLPSASMARESSTHWTNRSWLRDVQYRTDANLTARQSIYAYQVPKLQLPRLVIDLAGLKGGETLADVGCGNGAYLAEFSRRSLTGNAIGFDFSLGMLRAARERAPECARVAADATRVPLRDRTVDVTVAAHMLYHVPDPAETVRELRRITRSGGRVLVVLNGADHLEELRSLVSQALRRFGVSRSGESLWGRMSLDRGEELLSREFSSIERVDFPAELVIPRPEPIEAYVRSMSVVQNRTDGERFARYVASAVPSGAALRVRTRAGCLVCS
jgi:SAM-dependent methyltransferase